MIRPNSYYQGTSVLLLSPEEKEQLQRIIAEQNNILAAAPSFAVKRAAQKVKLQALKKLGLITNSEKSPTN